MSTTATQLLTADDLWQMPGHGKGYELVKGELVEMPPPGGGEHGFVIMNLSAPAAIHAKAKGLGACFGAETGFVLSTGPDSVRACDFGFVARARIPATGIPAKYFPGAPDLAVEVVSPWDRMIDVLAKVEQWQAAGTALVWLVEPRHRKVTVYQQDEEPVALTEADTLTGGSVLPGFSLPVKALFS